MIARKGSLGLVATAVGAAGAASLAYRIVGFVGVAILGALILFIATRIELEDEVPFSGVQGSHLLGHIASARERRTRSEKASDQANKAALLHATKFAKFIGLVLLIAGAIGFFL